MTTDAIADLRERVERLEQAVFARRSTFEPREKSARLLQQNSIAVRRQIFRQLLERQGITNQSIGAQALQKMLEQERLEPNEMSRSVREMREE